MAEPPSHILRYLDPCEAAGGVSQLGESEREVLERINEKVAGAESLEALVDFVFDGVRRVSACDRISLAFVEEGGRRIVSHVTRAAYEPVLLKKGYAGDLAGSSLEAILRQGRVRLINDLEAYLGFYPQSASTRLLVREGVRSSLTCPLIVEGRRVGVLFRSARRPNAYEDRHAAFQSAIAERLGQAVEKAYRIEQLAAANRAYFEMLGFVTHELRSPVATMMMDAQLAVDGYLGELSPKLRDRLGRIIASGQHLLDLIGEYLNLARLEGGEMRARVREGVDLAADVIERAISLVSTQMAAKEMRLVRQWPTEPLRVRVDPALMQIVMVNLLSNGVKYGLRGGEIRVRASREGDRLRVSVRNEGPGFPPEQRSQLFRKFMRLDVPALREEKGTGVGLYTVWRIIQAHRGRVDAVSEPGQWAEFTFEIPQGAVGGAAGEGAPDS